MNNRIHDRHHTPNRPLLSYCGADLRLRGVAVAWLALNSGDNDPTVFWQYVLAAMAPTHPPLAGDMSPAALVPALLNTLAALTQM